MNTYGYVYGNPLYWIDPYGLAGELTAGEIATGTAETTSGLVGAPLLAVILSVTPSKMGDSTCANGGCTVLWHQNENASDSENNNEPKQCDSNTNPYNGPVDEPVVVVDENGNAIPVNPGESVTSSPDGDYQQVRDKNGNQTGVRLDRGGHRTHSNPNAQNPHAHVPGVTRPNGDPHLPIN